MARQGTIGFESGVYSTSLSLDGEDDMVTGWDITDVGTPDYTATGRNGGLAMLCAKAGQHYIQVRDVSHTAGQPMYCRFYFKIGATPSQTAQLFQWRLDTIIAADIRVTASRTLELRDGTPTLIGSASAPLTVGAWYRIETRVVINPGTGVGEIDLWLADEYGAATLVASSASANTGTPTVMNNATHRLGHLTLGETASDFYYDDIAFNDHTGDNNSTYPGPGNLTMLKPYTDYAVGTGWVDGAAGGPPLFGSVNNFPPQGLSFASAANGTQIKNSTNLGATSYYYALTNSLETEVGAAATGATIRLACGYARGSCDDITGANNLLLVCGNTGDTVSGDLEISSVNPGTDVGPTPSGWKSYRTPMRWMPNLPSTSVGVIAVGREAGATPQHTVDQMGVLVEWLPAVTSRVRGPRSGVRLG